MQVKEVKDYFNHWANNSNSRASKMMFLEMLSGKAFNAGTGKHKIFAGGKMRTAKGLNKMLCIADDMFFSKA